MPLMLLRKLIRFGQEGLVLTIPKGWARYHALKAGDKVELLVNDSLTIKPQPKGNVNE